MPTEAEATTGPLARTTGDGERRLQSSGAEARTEQSRRYRASVQLVGKEGTAVEIDVVGYQFPGARASETGFDWDANWLRVRGRVSDGERRWSFDDPCLVTSEAAELTSWLRGVVSGEIAPGAYVGS